MNTIRMLALTILLCLFSFSSLLACTAEELQQKIAAFDAKVKQLTPEQMEVYSKVIEELEATLPKNSENTKDYDAVCKFYDEAMNKLQ